MSATNLRPPPQARPGQDLIVHLRAVAEWARAMAEPFGLGCLAHACGLLHDLGKYSDAFKKYLREALEGKTVRRGEVPHAWEGALAMLRQLGESPSTMGLADILANVVASHHGGLTDMVSDAERVIPRRLHSLAQAHPDDMRDVLACPEVASLLEEIGWDEVRREFAALWKRVGKKQFALHLAVKFLYSCLVDADRCDAAGLKHDGQSPDWNAMERCLDARLDKFADIPSQDRSPLDAVRALISSQCASQADRAPGVFTLSVPTGGGKTLSSLRFAIRHARANSLKRIVYVIPYLSIIDQTARDFRNLFDARADEWLLEHHSNFVLEDDDAEEEKRHELGTQRWNAPIIVTTMVQFLESVFSNKASDLRKFHNMMQTVFVFDEVQALPVKCTHLFNAAINFLHGFGGSTCVLCSATQPRLADKSIVDRPLALSPFPDLVSLPASFKPVFHRTVLVDMTSSELTCEQIAELALSRFRQGKHTVVVLNTKADARKVFKALADGIPKYFLSTDMCPAHRLDVLDRMRLELAPDKPAPRTPILCVSTQLIEAGVDISFDCVIRAEAGFDSVIQVAGRCNRHGHSPIPQEVIVVRVAAENLKNLPEIALGKSLTERLVQEKLLDDPERALESYYAYKFGLPSQKILMDYPTPDNGPTLFDALGKNIRAAQAFKDAHGDRPYPGLHAAFQFAAEHFAVIDGFHIGVVVPYESPGNPNAVQQLVTDFNDSCNRFVHTFDRESRATIFRERSRILRRLQQYTVSVYANKESDIKQIATPIGDAFDAFYFLAPDRYDPVIGLNSDMGLLNL